MINSADLKECAHEDCGCPAKSGSLYCSPARESGKGSEAICRYGHRECIASEVAA